MHRGISFPATFAILRPTQTYLLDKVLDTFGNLYAVTRDTDAYPIAVVPFEDLPAHDDPGLILE